MGRIRTIKPEFQQSESMGRVSRNARLLFIELWTFADDSGRARAASRMLASALFPYDDDAPNLIDGWISELEREHCIRRYSVDGAAYLEIVNWEKHQRVDKPSPSRLPPFREGSLNIRELSNVDLVPSTVVPGTNRDAGASLADAKAPTPELPLGEPIKLNLERDKLADARERMRVLAENWNDLACDLHLPRVEEIKPGSPREKAALARLRDKTDFDRIFVKIRGSPFLRGEKGHTPACFDWIINPTNITKIVEGNYDEDRNRKARR